MEFIRPRRDCRQVTVGDIQIGGRAPIVIQSMLNAPSDNIDANIVGIALHHSPHLLYRLLQE